MVRSVLKILHSTLEHSRTGNVPEVIGDSFLVVAEIGELYKVSGSWSNENGKTFPLEVNRGTFRGKVAWYGLKDKPYGLGWRLLGWMSLPHRIFVLAVNCTHTVLSSDLHLLMAYWHSSLHLSMSPPRRGGFSDFIDKSSHSLSHHRDPMCLVPYSFPCVKMPGTSYTFSQYVLNEFTASVVT